jgi:flavin reductase ActVB
MELISEETYEDAAAVSLDGSALYIHVTRAPGLSREPALRQPWRSVSDRFRASMRALASGVVLVTTHVSGRPWGVTVTSCCSLSVEPPRILLSLMRGTATCQAIEANGVFGLALLGDSHRHVAELGAARGAPKFLDAPTRLVADTTGLAPVVEGALSHLDCELEQVLDGGDHAIIIGRVVGVDGDGMERDASPLLYFGGRFHVLGGRL